MLKCENNAVDATFSNLCHVIASIHLKSLDGSLSDELVLFLYEETKSIDGILIS